MQTITILKRWPLSQERILGDCKVGTDFYYQISEGPIEELEISAHHHGEIVIEEREFTSKQM